MAYAWKKNSEMIHFKDSGLDSLQGKFDLITPQKMQM